MNKSLIISTVLGLIFVAALVLVAYRINAPKKPALPMENKPAQQTSVQVINPNPQSQNNVKSMNTVSIMLSILIFGLLNYGCYWYAKKSLNRFCSDKTLSNEEKLKKIENEDVLFDLPLYIGLGGTVAGFVFISWGWNFISRDVAYISTIAGIISSAFMRLRLLRKCRCRLLSSKEVD